MIGNSVLFADFSENFPSCPDKLGMFYFFCENRSEIFKGVSFVGTSRDETYFSIFKRTKCCDETLGRSGFGIIDKLDSIFLSDKFETMRKSRYIFQIFSRSLRAYFQRSSYKRRRKNIHRIMDPRKLCFAEFVFLSTGDNDIFSVGSIFEIFIYSKYPHIWDIFRDIESKLLGSGKHLFVNNGISRCIMEYPHFRMEIVLKVWMPVQVIGFEISEDGMI